METKPTILVAEDETSLRTVYTRQLEVLGFQVESAPDGEKALKALAARRFDLVMTDIHMPGSVDGVELVRRTKADYPNTDVIVVTGAPTLDTAVRALKHGASEYLTKPFSHDQLEVVMARMLANRRLRGELDREKSIRTELQAAYAQLEKVQKLQDAFMSRVSHELRTPIAVASGRITLVEPKLKGVDRDHLERAQKALSKLDEIVADLLTFSELLKDKLELKLEEVDAAKLLRGLLKEYAPLFEKKEVEVRIELPKGLASVRADPDLLRTAFRHLVTNAALFNTFRGFARFSGQAKGGWVHLEFENSGMELPSGKTDLIFDSFYQVAETLTREVGGLGLGLAIVRRIAENHGGTVRANPRKEGGALFFLDLPGAK